MPCRGRAVITQKALGASRITERMVTRNLVIVRAGDSSLHPGWGRHEQSSPWDLYVSYFGERATCPYDGDDVVAFKGPKLAGVANYLSIRPNLLPEYDYIYLPDDDLETTAADISRLFDLMESCSLSLGQPSLSYDSFVSRNITLHNPNVLVRYTNWVESMAPCFSTDALALCQHTFTCNRTGWGQEILWCNMLAGTNIGIVDAVQVRHTRPFGGPNLSHAEHAGTSALCELAALLVKEKVRQPILRLNGIVTPDGRTLQGAEFNADDLQWLTAPW